MFGLLIDVGIGAVVVAAGVATYKLWKANKAVTGAAVVSGTETVIQNSATAVAPAVETVVQNAVTSAVEKVISKV